MAKKKTGNALVKWDEEFANFAKETTKGAVVTGGSKFIRFSGGRMSFDGADIPDDEIRCVIVGWQHHNTYYDPKERFDPENPATPICYAFGDTEEEMEPHSAAPEPQNDSCATCPLNEWESGVGRAKACKNTVRLALIAEDDLEDIDNAEVVYASLPPTSIKNWLVYLTKELRDKAKRPHWAVVTLLSRVPDDRSQFRINFKNEELIEDSDLFGPLKQLWEETTQTIDFPYAAREVEAKPKKSTAKSSKKKFAK